MRLIPLVSRRSVAVLAAALLVSACATVDLGPRYDPPPARLPQPLPQAQAPTPPLAQPQAVPPSLPQPQPLPPVGQSMPVFSPGSSGAVPAPIDPRSHLVTFTTRMEGGSVVPATRSAATAQLDALYDSQTRVLRWKTVWSGISSPITGVQFHGPADDGQNAPAVMMWPGPFGPTYEGRATLSVSQAVDLINGRWYITVYTASYPSGELRGQLRVVY